MMSHTPRSEGSDLTADPRDP